MPIKLEIIFHGDLKLFLKKKFRREGVSYALNRRASIKDIIESLGVPHTEIGRLLCDSREIDFTFGPENNHQLEVFPITPPLDIKKRTRLQPCAWNTLRFLVDENVGKLAALLRILGFDTAYKAGIEDRLVAAIAEKEKRVVLSKDIALLKRKAIAWGRYIRSVRPYDQLREVVGFFDLHGPYALFSRCVDCNTPLQPVEKNKIIHRLEPKTIQYYETFQICPDCNRLLWWGSHCERIIINMQKAGIPVRD